MASKTYSFVDTQATIIGPGITTSITEGTSEEGITISMRAEKDDLVVGADGSCGTGGHGLGLPDPDPAAGTPRSRGLRRVARGGAGCEPRGARSFFCAQNMSTWTLPCHRKNGSHAVLQ